MPTEAEFQSLWNRYADFSVTDTQDGTCPYARKFSEWANELVNTANHDPTPVKVAQSKLLLQDKFWEFLRATPKSHRCQGGRHGQCLFPLWEIYFTQLRTVELSITPPMLFAPASTQPPQPQSIPGIFLGELDRGEGNG